MRILVFGSCNIDMVYSLENIVMPGETVSADGLQKFPGGKGFNQAVASARSGYKVSLAGKIGRDGIFMKRIAEDYGIDTEFLEVTDSPTGHAIIQVDKSGENSIIIFGGANRKIDKKFADSVLENFECGDIMLLQNEINCLDYIIDKAFEKGIKTVLNMSPVTNELKLINKSKLYCVLVNEREAEACFGAKTHSEFTNIILSEYPRTNALLTLGKRGSIYISQNKVFQMPAFETKAVDTTAAGDTFTGYFITSLANGDSPEDALRLASCAASIAVSREGASSSIPSRDEVLRLMPEMSPSKIFSEDGYKAELLMRYINENISSADLSGAAAVLGYSAAYTGSWIKKHFGTGFSRLLGKTRCNRAAEMLLTTELSVSEIISRVGYTNESHFRNIFLSIYGTTPLSYRKRKS